MFFAGAIIISLYNKKQDIISFIKKFYELNRFEIYELNFNILKKSAINLCDAIIKYSVMIWENIKLVSIKLTETYLKIKFVRNLERPNLLLIKRFIELKEERKNLGKLLLASIRENKNVRMRFQLENLAKNRLARYIEHTHKLIKESRCRYVSFQQLYLATHQENLFLKTRIKKLIDEKENTERNLIALINAVCQSKNKELKAFCSRYIVETKNNLLNSDVKNEIRNFLNKSVRNRRAPLENSSKSNLIESDTKIIEKIENEYIIISEAPKLRGLPGEYVWTVKDKDGLIEKLYECNIQNDCDNGDTIRRIRQYSVYYDKNCLLDSTSSASFTNQANNICKDCNIKQINYPITSHKFLTGSQAFQTFLKHNENIVQCPMQRTQIMPCG
ncbi:uncharacterized protein LOC119835066 [Zerene cesonia]|uniref:uncharacterized protein LOC119835066 n=1 Tax=Zerene cesonia TaxID=33412 RepID=UPI0018E4ECDB|nr:uncharacterized protein LOC119835066 [Zerene cesonia]